MTADSPNTAAEYISANAESLVERQLAELGMPPGPRPAWQQRLIDERVRQVRLECAVEAEDPDDQPVVALPALVGFAIFLALWNAEETEAENLASAAAALDVPRADMAWLVTYMWRLLAQHKRRNTQVYESLLLAIVRVGEALTGTNPRHVPQRGSWLA